MFKVLLCFIFASLMLELTSCSPIKVIPMSIYTVGQYPAKSQRKKTTTHLTLLITTPVANPGYQTHHMIYVQHDLQLESYANHRWVAPPAQMIVPALTAALQNLNYFEAVATPPFTGTAHFRLDTKLIMLQQNFVSSPTTVRLAMQATLINNKTNRILGSQQFTTRVPTQDNPYSGVKSAAIAVQKVTQSIAKFTVRLTHKATMHHN